MNIRVNVRMLAEFTLLKGDLQAGTAALERMNEGALGHKQLQLLLGEEWTAEEYVRRTEALSGAELLVQGRADAVSRAGGELRVLEIKTVSGDPSLMTVDLYPAHLAQGQIYAYMICANEGWPRAEVELCYYRLDGARQRFIREYTAGELRAVFLKCALPYIEWQKLIGEWKEAALPTLKSLRFPFPEFREGQREMAAEVYRAMRGGKALIEAPTGIGKTAAALFGALKALGEGRVNSLFYLTARTTGRRAAQQALDRMRATGLKLRSIEITAKEKCCLLENKDCFGCPYAQDYYQRRRDALREALGIERFDEAAVRDLAVEYELCPYELSLDISEETDVIICDYNYAFDPRVRLKRYFDQKSRAGLLIDEAHNLPERAMEMLSAEISGARAEEVYRLAARYEGRESPICQALKALILLLTGETERMEVLEALPEATLEGLERFTATLGEIGPAEPEARDLMLDAVWFCRVVRKLDADSYRLLKRPEGKRFALRAWCFDPAGHIRRTLSRTGGAALFSATLAPMQFYARRLGLDEGQGDALTQLPSPFPRRNLLVARLPVNVTYSQREASLPKVTAILRAMTQARPGNYIACFPSFQYMEQVYRYYRMSCPEARVLCQKAHMSEAERSAFIARFRPEPRESLLAFIVLGGIFAEGVDLPDDLLVGAAIISTGMPMLTEELALLAELLDDGFGGGMDAAYTYPGLRRVLQAAGRVIRTETDRGVVLLLDKRYDSEALRELLPEHWDVERITRLEALQERLRAFWGKDPANSTMRSH